MSDDCIFCKIISGEVPSDKIYEDDEVVVFLDANPHSPGHSLVVPKEHAKNFIEASEEAVCKVTKVARKLAPKITDAVGADACNFTTNCGEAAGQVVFHTHFHLIPRFSESEADAKFDSEDKEKIVKAVKERVE